MTVFRDNKASLVGGVISPAIQGHTDLAKYSTSLKDALNFFIHAQGGASNRAGTEIVSEVKGSGIARQFPFIFDAETNQTYDLLFSNLATRFTRNGVPILNEAVAITSVSIASPAVMTAAAHGYVNGQEVIIAGIAGATFLNNRNFIVAGVTTNTFTLLDMYGVAINSATAGTGGTVKSIYEVANSYLAADLGGIDYVQEKDVMYLTHEKYPPQKLSRFADNNWTLTTLTFIPKTAAPTGLGGSANFVKKPGSSAGIAYKVTAVSPAGAESAVSLATSLTVQYSVDDGRRIKISWTASAGAAYYNLYRTDASVGILASTTSTSIDVSQTQNIGDGTPPPASSAGGAPPVPTSITSIVVNGSPIRYKVSAINDATGEESLPSSETSLDNALSFKGNKNVLFWAAVAGASTYKIYKFDNGRWGYIGLSQALTFTDENITADLALGPQEAVNPFVGAGNYPACLTFHEQRLSLGGSTNEPTAVVLGQSSNYENFGSASPAAPSDAILFKIRSKEKNKIKAMVSLRGLIVFTSAAEFTVSGGSQDFLTPSNIVIRPQTFRGIDNIKPIIVGNVILYVQARSNVIRAFSYNFQNDNFIGNDLTIMARHLFEGRTIKSWAYAQSPHSIVWVVLDNGQLLSLTYVQEHEVWAWMSHATDGFFEDVIVIPETREDVPYFIVRRIVNGQTKRYQERMKTRIVGDIKDCFFVDCGLSYVGAPTQTLSGLHHLEGKMVSALVNGDVIEGLLVSNGSISLPQLPTGTSVTVTVGLPYESYIQTLDIEMGLLGGLGTVQGRQKSVAEVSVRVEKSRGMFIGRALNKLSEWKQRAAEAYNDPIGLFSGITAITPNPDWDKSGSFYIQQKYPLPLTILSILPEVKVGG
jgi:hypothetical protein